MSARFHRCAVPGCAAQIAIKLAMCKAHWYLLPAALQRRIWSEFRRQPMSEAHLAAIGEGVKAVAPPSANLAP